MTAVTDPVCAATVILHDDRWGAINERCELPVGHDGDHLILMGATEPMAFVRWST